MESTDRKEKGYVNLYHICNHYVKPWTRNLGNSIALLMNNSKPLKAQVMISHAWDECIIESMVAVLGRAAVIGMSLDDVIWFCTFAQYQPGDMEGDCGPGVAAQLALDPFKKVINSDPQYGMVVIHTSRAELYGRLWCVYEVNEADACDVIPTAAVSMRYLKKIIYDNPDGTIGKGQFTVDCENAVCSFKDDETMIKGKIAEAGGYEKLNAKIESFRATAVGRMYSVAKEFVQWGDEFMNEDPEQAVEHLIESVQAAARLVGLHCLTALALQDEDDEYGKKILEFAADEIGLFKAKFMNIDTPPPYFDPSKACPLPESEEELIQLLKDIHKFPFATGLLEMGAGGNVMAMALDAAGMQARHAVSKKKLKKVFRAWDTNGDGTISEDELSAVLMKIHPEFTEHDCKTMFRVSDKNRDGKVDYDEFIEWLMQDFER